jgi:hypothetical protein
MEGKRKAAMACIPYWDGGFAMHGPEWLFFFANEGSRCLFEKGAYLCHMVMVTAQKMDREACFCRAGHL